MQGVLSIVSESKFTVVLAVKQSLIFYPNARDPRLSSILVYNLECMIGGKMLGSLVLVVVVVVGGAEGALLEDQMHNMMVDIVVRIAGGMLVHKAFVVGVEIDLLLGVVKIQHEVAGWLGNS